MIQKLVIHMRFAMLSLQNRGKDTNKILHTQGCGSAYANFIQNVSIFTH